MATQLTVTEFYADLNNLTNNKFGNVSEPQQLRYLKRALLNTYPTLKSHCNQVYDKVGVLSGDGTPNMTLPTDIDLSSASSIVMYTDEARTDGISNDVWRVYGGEIRFDYNIEVNTSYYIEYSKEPSSYATSGLKILETKDLRCLEVLQSEVEHLRDVDIRQGQTSGQAQSSRFRSNEIS